MSSPFERLKCRRSGKIEQEKNAFFFFFNRANEFFKHQIENVSASDCWEDGMQRTKKDKNI